MDILTVRVELTVPLAVVADIKQRGRMIEIAPWHVLVERRQRRHRRLHETFASDAHLLLLFDLRGIEFHVDARRIRNLQQALHRLQRILQEVLIHFIPLC